MLVVNETSTRQENKSHGGGEVEKEILQSFHSFRMTKSSVVILKQAEQRHFAKRRISIKFTPFSLQERRVSRGWRAKREFLPATPFNANTSRQKGWG